MTEATITLTDNRLLSYARYGDPSGFPVIYYHGTPSSRLELEQWPHFGLQHEDLLRQRGLSLIAVDRPGMGGSTFNPKGSVLSFADDITALLQHLGIRFCSVLAWSGGGPFALALAYRLPQVVRQVQIFCGFSRHFDTEVVRHMRGNKAYFRTAQLFPALLRFLMGIVSKQQLRMPPPRMLTSLKPSDYRYFGNPRLYNVMTDVSIKEACRQGARGAVYEAALYFRPFGFALEAVSQPVHYWWGYDDTMVIGLHAEAIGRRVPQGTVHYKPQEGHLSIYVHYFGEVLDMLAANASPLSAPNINREQ